jgi:hypothetical protein
LTFLGLNYHAYYDDGRVKIRAIIIVCGWWWNFFLVLNKSRPAPSTCSIHAPTAPSLIIRYRLARSGAERGGGRKVGSARNKYPNYLFSFFCGGKRFFIEDADAQEEDDSVLASEQACDTRFEGSIDFLHVNKSLE